jgi:uncharacterized protein
MTRTAEVDTIRGLALLGICIVNIPFLAQPVSALTAPQSGVDHVVRLATQMFFEGKFFVLFSFIFGWGFAIQLASAARAGASGTARFGRRLAGLLMIGIAHAVLVFFGDILVLYALLGVPLLLMRDLSPARLMSVAGAAAATAGVVLYVLAVEFSDIVASFPVSEGSGYLGDFGEGIRQRLRDWPDGFAFVVMFNGPLAFAAFCAGLAAAKVGFFERGNAIYEALRRRIRLLLPTALALNLVYALASSGYLGTTPVAALAFALLAVGGPMLGLVYLIGAVELARRGRLQGATVAAGRMSLTVYVLEGILAGLIFNGYGLGLYGKVGPLGCLAIAIAVYLVAHGFAALWLRSFRQGPLEYTLRWITRGGDRSLTPATDVEGARE